MYQMPRGRPACGTSIAIVEVGRRVVQAEQRENPNRTWAEGGCEAYVARIARQAEYVRQMHRWTGRPCCTPETRVDLYLDSINGEFEVVQSGAPANVRVVIADAEEGEVMFDSKVTPKGSVRSE